MPTGLKRFQQTKQFHFITLSCYERQPFLHTPAAKETPYSPSPATRIPACPPFPSKPATKARVPHPSRFCEGWDVHSSSHDAIHAVSPHEWAIRAEREPLSSRTR